MTTLTPPRPPGETKYSAADLSALPSDSHFELIQGKLRPMSMPTGSVHGKKTALLTLFLMRHIMENDLGDGFAAETGFLLAQNPDTVKAPDFGFVAKRRLPATETPGYLPVVPDLILETRSPSDRETAAKAKIDEWISAGVLVALDLNPARQTLTVYAPAAAPRVLTPADTLDNLSPLPGFSLPLIRVFG